MGVGNWGTVRNRARLKAEAELRKARERIAELEQELAKAKSLKVEVYQQDWVPGFAAFRDDGSMEEGTAHVVLNLGAVLCAVALGDLDKEDVALVVGENLVHELGHVIEAWAGAEFSEKRVEKLVAMYQKYVEEERVSS
jgi:hypothetical protein